MAAKIDQFRKMKREELVAMRDDIEIVIREKTEEDTNEFKREMQDRAKALGIDLDTLFGVMKRRGPKAGATAAIKKAWRVSTPKTTAKVFSQAVPAARLSKYRALATQQTSGPRR